MADGEPFSRHPTARRELHCGWLEPDEWLPKPGPFIQVGHVKYDGDPCPGWFKEQPFMDEAVQAATALKENYLQHLYPDGVPAALLEAAQIVVNSWNAYQHWEIREQQKEKG